MAFIKNGDTVTVDYFDSDGEKVSDEDLQKLTDTAQPLDEEEPEIED